MTPWARAAATTSALARATSACSNCPGERMAEAGMAPWWPDTKSIRPKSSTCSQGRAAMACTSRSAPWVSMRTWIGMLSARGPPLLRHRLHMLDHLGDLSHRRRLGDGQVGQHVTRATDDDVDVLPPRLAGVIVDAHARHALLVGVRAEHVRHHLGVLALAAGRRAVLEVHGDVERAELLLELERLADQLLGAGEVLTRRNHWKRAFAREQGLLRMAHGAFDHKSRPWPALSIAMRPGGMNIHSVRHRCRRYVSTATSPGVVARGRPSRAE